MSLKNDLQKYTPRKEQNDVLKYIKNICEKKPDNKFFLLNIPTGSGKSHIALMIADYMRNKVLKDTQVDIITAGKLLQDQYENTYEEIKSLRGKDNYDCIPYSCSCEKGKEFNKLNKSSCDNCPYDEAKKAYIDSDVSLTNFHLYLINSIYAKGMERESKLLIVDECDCIDTVMSDFISIKITETIIKKFHFANEAEIIRKLKNEVTDIETYVEYIKYFLNEINCTMLEIEKFLSSGRTEKNSDKRDKRNMKINAILDLESKDVKFMQLINDLKQYTSKIDVFLKEYLQNKDNWILESIYNEKLKTNELSLEPIWASEYLQKYVWFKYDKIILLSGTILNKKLFSEFNGIDVDKSVYYSISSPFPVENRKIYYMPIGKMSFKKKTESFKKFIPILNKILKKYNDKKGIIHTNSFELSNWIEENIENDRLIFHASSNKEEMLRLHFTSDKPTVFVSPSVGTGVSFDHDISRFQIIPKMPYPSLASAKNKKRNEQNSEWYIFKTVCNLMQICGRSIRSKTDYADTIIIDSCFGDVLRNSGDYFPQWFLDAVMTINK